MGQANSRGTKEERTSQAELSAQEEEITCSLFFMERLQQIIHSEDFLKDLEASEVESEEAAKVVGMILHHGSPTPEQVAQFRGKEKNTRPKILDAAGRFIH